VQAVVAAGSDGSAFGDGLEGLFEVLEAVVVRFAGDGFDASAVLLVAEGRGVGAITT